LVKKSKRQKRIDSCDILLPSGIYERSDIVVQSIIRVTRLLLPVLALCVTLGVMIRAFRRRPAHGFGHRPWFLFLALTLFGVMIALCITNETWWTEPLTLMLFIAFLAVQWMSFVFAGRGGMRAELTGFFLTDLGLMVAALNDTGAFHTQLICVAAGIAGFYILRFFLRNPAFMEYLRIPAAVCCLGLLVACLIFADPVNDSKSWITIAGFTFQPSEIAKVCYVLAAAIPERKRGGFKELLIFTVFSAASVLCLVVMNDLGSAVVFFCGFLAAAAMRKWGYPAAAAGLLAGGGGGYLALNLSGRAAGRFATWGKAWEFANEGGYQQTRAMAAAASGGLLGLGVGQGWLRDVYAASTDLVFCVICEELGLIVAICAILMIFLTCVQAVFAARRGRSPYLVSCACIAAMILAIQAALNALGSVDILPFTGVTFPLISQGGTSAMTCWWLLAFTGTEFMPAFHAEEEEETPSEEEVEEE